MRSAHLSSGRAAFMILSVTSGFVVSVATPAAAYHTCYTTAYTPNYRAESPGTIIADADMSCNVPVTNVNIRLCIQVSNNLSNWWDQVCGDHRVGGAVTYHWARGYWTCIGSNPWYYRTKAYSVKTFDTGQTSNSGWKYSSAKFAYC